MATVIYTSSYYRSHYTPFRLFLLTLKFIKYVYKYRETIPEMSHLPLNVVQEYLGTCGDMVYPTQGRAGTGLVLKTFFLVYFSQYTPTMIDANPTINQGLAVQNPAINAIIRYFIRRHLPDEISDMDDEQSEQSVSQSENSLLLNTTAILGCTSTTIWRDLGTEMYPRFLSEIVCSPSPCLLGYSACAPIYHNVSVLTIRNQALHTEDPTMPLRLRDEWVFKSIRLPVACVCARIP